ncbi:MAG: HD-GYP domain-containing protein, partial [Actinomycetota bacterium]
MLRLARANRRTDVLAILVERLHSSPGVPAAAGALATDNGRPASTLWRDDSGWSDLPDRESEELLGQVLRSGSWATDPSGSLRLAAPLWVAESVVGALAIGGEPTDGSRAALEDASALGTLTLENATLRRNAARSLTEVATVLSALIESRDTYTESHCVALAETSVGVGIRLGLADDRLTVLNLAGHMHDIGKVSVPDAILLKPGPLTEGELSVMQSHASIGEEVLMRIRDFADVAPVVGQHHERYDGDGYPRGLRGDEILLEARILAVADAYDAMTSSRPYRRALPEEVALGEP